ncbi:MAG TPA: O-antigen ligase family protein [Moraxellaceae bacterium]|nr:O-antigen ligase family protein [Moraxellaceae bacterium]
MSRSSQWKALMLAGPLILFPFARSYYLFYVAILVWGLVTLRPRGLWAQSRELRLAFYAFGLPILMPLLGWALTQSGAPLDWGNKLLTVLLACLLGLATKALSDDESVCDTAGLLITVAIASWGVEGVLQLVSGHSLDCRGALSPCMTDGRISLYYGHRAKLGYYIGMLTFLPAAWLVSRRRTGAALAVLLLGGVVTMASASRFSMLAFLIGISLLGLVLALRAPLPARARLALAVGAPVLLVALGIALYHLNPTFHERVQRTLLAFGTLDYARVNKALTGRLDIWEPLLRMARDHWLFGVGPGDLDAGIRPYLGEGNAFLTIRIFHAHQVLLDVLAATGVLGLLAFLVYYARVVADFVRASAGALDLRWAALLVFLLMWFPLNSPNGFYSSEMVFLTFYVLGLGYGLGGGRPAAR